MICFARQWWLKYSKAFKMHKAKNVKLILWLWWMYCGYLFGVGGRDKKEYDKRYIYFSFAESNQNKHMTPTRYDSTHFDTFPLLSLPMTLKTKTNLKFSLRQGSIRSQCISNRFCFCFVLLFFCEFLLINLLHQRLMLLIRIVLNQ